MLKNFSFASVAFEDFTTLIYTVTRHLKPHVKEAVLDAREKSKPSVRQVVEMSKDSLMRTAVLGEKSIFLLSISFTGVGRKEQATS